MFHVRCRSAIHGRGLFCKRNIEAGEMVIEYAGIVIRSVLTDKREKYYDGKVGGVFLSVTVSASWRSHKCRRVGWRKYR